MGRGRDYLARIAAFIVSAGFLLLIAAHPAGSALEIPRPTAQMPFNAGRSYFIDANRGSDQNKGSSPEAPWRTLSMLRGRELFPGDTVYLARGSVWRTNLFIPYSGNATAPIYYTAYGSGPRPVIQPELLSDRAITVHAAYIVLDGLRIAEGRYGAVNITTAAHHVTVQDMEITNTGMGIEVYGSDNSITRNYIHDLNLIRNTPGGDDDYGANGVLVTSARNQITRNRFVGCRGPSHDYGMDGGAIELYGQNVDGNVIMYNFATENDGFVEVGGGSASDTTVAYNIAHNNNGRFAWFNMSGRFAATVHNFRIHNNTVVETAPRRGPALLWFGDTTPPPGMLDVRNNIFAVAGTSGLATSPAFQHDHNLFSLGPRASLGFPLADHDEMGDPAFFSMDKGDFRIEETSAAIRLGVPLGYPSDYAARSLDDVSQPDAGAYQQH